MVPQGGWLIMAYFHVSLINNNGVVETCQVASLRHTHPHVDRMIACGVIAG